MAPVFRWDCSVVGTSGASTMALVAITPVLRGSAGSAMDPALLAHFDGAWWLLPPFEEVTATRLVGGAWLFPLATPPAFVPLTDCPSACGGGGLDAFVLCSSGRDILLDLSVL